MKTMILIYGLGGSGTRLYIDLLKLYGIYVGNNLNESLDDLNTFWNSDYYNVINNKLSFQDYDLFKNIFKKQLKVSGYLDNDIFCIKEPNFIILIHFVIKFCKDYNINLKTIHAIRNYKYMINSLNRNQSERWKHLFFDKYNPKYNKTKYQIIEYWCYANKYAIDLVKKNNLNYLILNYNNFISSPDEEIYKILNLVKLNQDISKNIKFKNTITKKTRSKTDKILNIPEELVKLTKQISNEIN